MTGATPASMPTGAARFRKIGRNFMEIILHVGAHRSGTTTFQQYVRRRSARLEVAGIGFWGPGRTRKSIFPGLLRHPSHPTEVRRAEGRVQMQMARLRAAGFKQLLVSDENMIGASRACMRHGALYPAIGERMARISAAFGGQVTRIVMTIRAQDLWWASAAAYTVARGHAMPTADQCKVIAQSTRGWRDVITDLACAVPNAELVIMPFEQSVGSPDLLLKAATGLDMPRDAQALWLNKSLNARDLRRVLADQGADYAQIPDALMRWQPFSPTQTAHMRENYADDLHWLIAGADGLAQLTENTDRKRAGTSLPAGQITRGNNHDSGQGHTTKQGHVARSG